MKRKWDKSVTKMGWEMGFYRRGSSTQYHKLARTGPGRYVHRTYKLNEELADRINATANAHHVGVSDLVRFLLSEALDQVETGQMRIRTRPPGLLVIDAEGSGRLR